MPNDPAPNRRIVVDGSNLATEGRSLPSLAQLEEAIQAFLEEFPGFRNADVIVVVDASFGHRIDESERAAFEDALAHGEMVTPPAGAIGRGDAFILRIAEKAGALVLSNDSFQEFHAERPWLFEPGRLIGGKPIPGVGWIFTPRTPVRGAVSRATTSRAKKAAVAEDDATSTSSQGGRTAGRTTKAGGSTKKSGGRRRGKASETAPDAETDEWGEGVSTGTADTGGAGGAAGAGDVAGAGDSADPGDEAPKKARSTAKKTGGRAKKAAAVDKVGAPIKAGAPTKAAAKAAKSAKATKAAAKTAKTTKAPKSTAGTSGAAGASKAVKATAKAAKGTASKGRGGAKAAVHEVPDEESGPIGPGKRPGRRAKKSAARAEMAQAGTGDEAPLPALNEPMTFLTFVANHPIGSRFKGTVASYTSHGAHIDVDGMKAHVPLSLLGRPAPGKARDVLSKGETRDFVLVSLDAPRRRAEVALPE
ncbi:MAG TPA: S1 RNA-binding domain-containing protein, partial [Acidimicrobiales bacterium]|nr:S1 RNA-binding domain-containing protein [Acidimicrobiales bacterium]